MTKEELEKEAEEIYLKTDKEFMYCQDEGEIFNLGYLAGAEPREKQIEIDAKQIRALQKQNGELTDELKTLRESMKDYGAGCYENGLRNGRRKLEEQIEKMKCCGNCKKLKGRFDSKTNINILYCSDSDMKQIEVGFQMCCCKWEIKEK